MATANGRTGAAVERRYSDFPDYRHSVALKHVKRGYEVIIRHGLTILLIPVLGALLVELHRTHKSGELGQLWQVAAQTHLTFNLVSIFGCTLLLAVAGLSMYLLRRRPVFLVDYSVWCPPASWQFTYQAHYNGTKGCKAFTEESIEFQSKILSRSGLGQRTALPPGLAVLPPVVSMKAARDEFESVIFGAVEDLLKKTGVSPKQIGVLVVNCSLFNPTPSLSAMVIKHFKMSKSIISYNLAGMGCSAGIIAIDLARQMLQLYPSTYALVCSTENITQNWYFGNERAMMMPNCLFRVGGAAMLLSNRRRDAWSAKYELQHTVRTHIGSKEQAYDCIYQCEDDAGKLGVRLSKELMSVAGEALKINITTLGPMVLPVSEQLLFFANLVLRKVFKRKMRPYIPDFKKAFDHVCIHTGGRAVIDEIERQLSLTPALVEPSRASLFRFGNVSSSSIWYVLAFIESQRGVKRGDIVWQIAFGSGFKVNSAVWRAMRTIKDVHPAWADFQVQEMRDHLATLPNHHLEPKPKKEV